jgi:hypothetical protein
MMKIGTDSGGKVWLVGDALPSELNGIALTVTQLTQAQEAAYLALPTARAGVLFDGAAFTVIPVPPPSAEDLRAAVDATEAAAVKADAQVVTFLNFTPAQLDTWVDNNIGAAASLAALKIACATAFKVLGRIALAAGRGRSLR